MTAANNTLPDPHYCSPGYIDTLVPPGISASFNTTLSKIAVSTIRNERFIRIGESKKRRRNNATSPVYNTDNQSLCWEAFQPYLEKCIPVKVNNVASFRQNVTEGSTKEPVFSTMSVDSLPAEVLDQSITVQCIPSTNHESVHPSELADDEIRQKARDIDANLSMLSNNTSNSGGGGENIPIFMGQEDQVTACVSVRQLVTINDLTHHVSASQLPILDVDEMEQDSLSLNVDGKLNHQPTANLELSPLASLLRLPSYLLLGNPRNEPKDIVIHNINLWHAPQPCCTNVHYDDHDNLLIVTCGQKIVELCPPGCIQASGVYSTHANHPELLRRHGHMRADEDIQRDSQSTLERKQGRTHIVTVTTGEALYIPLGWWHRVVSKCDQYDVDEGSIGCTAINVWFDYHHPSRQSNVPDYMSVFHLRQNSRKYFELNKGYVTNLLLDEKKRTYFLENKEIPFPPEEIMNEEILIGQKDWREMNTIVFEKELDKASILAFGKIYRKCLSSILRTTSEDPRLPNNDLFYCMFEAFLHCIQLGNPSNVAGLVNMWTRFGLTVSQHHVRFFSEILRKLSPEACYILTQAWERHAAQDEAEFSYKCFFLNVESNEVRNHLLNGVEEFYHQAWVKLSSVV